MSEKMNLDWFVAQLRESVKEKRAGGAGMTEIAYRIGVSNQMLHAYLRGDGEPKMGTYLTMVRYFGWDHPLEDELDAAGGHSRWSTQTASELAEQGVMAGVL